MHIESLPSPAILIDNARLDANIASMQKKAKAQQVTLRPHTKTHKSITIAQRQVDAGASGLTVAKPGEAEVYARHGFSDIRIAYEVVGTAKYETLLSLMKDTRISFCVDTEEGGTERFGFF